MTGKPKLQRWKCVCAYDGAAFSGWQSQPDGNAIQDHIERRLKQIFKTDIRIHGSGRTDAGVHALGQVFHFDADWRHGSEKLLAAFRTGLPPAIRVTSARQVSEKFHARFKASGKIYFYNLHQGGMADPFRCNHCWWMHEKLDVGAMREAAALLVGTHDFKPFSAENGSGSDDTVRTLRRLEIAGRGANLRITAEADGFLYKMVRSLVGALVSVGTGKMAPGQISGILKSRKRVNLIQTAPPQGLFLKKVFYSGSAGAKNDED